MPSPNCTFCVCRYLSGLASNVETFCKDPIQKESFVETFKERHTIAVVLEEQQDEESSHRYSYVWLHNNGGLLEIHIPKDRFCSNVGNTGDDLTKVCSGDSPLSVATRKGIADSQKSLTQALKTLKTHSGIDFELEVDWVPIADIAKERGYEDRAGEIIHDWYLKGLASNVESFCKDPIQKESFVETFKDRHTIAFILEEQQDEESSHRYSYVWTANKGGVLEIHIPKDRFCSNVGNTGDDLTKTCSGDSPLSVATRKNIADNEKTRQKNVTRLTKATGIEFELEIDWVVMAETAKERGYEDRAGEIIYDWYLSALAGNLESLCKDDMSKEAVQESCEKKVIAFSVIETDQLLDSYSYVQCTFDDGTLKISIPREKFCSNVGNTGQDIESRL